MRHHISPGPSDARYDCGELGLGLDNNRLKYVLIKGYFGVDQKIRVEDECVYLLLTRQTCIYAAFN